MAISVSDFNVGDRVQCLEDTPTLSTSSGYIPRGTYGTVLEASRCVGIRWDIDVGGHTLDGACEPGYGWRFFEEKYNTPSIEALEKIESSLPVFNLDDYKDGKIAICCLDKNSYMVVAEYLDKMGKTWITGEPYTQFCPSSKTEICINVKDGTWDHKDYFENYGYKILSFEDFQWERDIDFESDSAMEEFLKDI